MTKKAFEKLGFPEKTFDISFDIEESEDDAVINQKLVQLIQKENQKVGIMDTFYLEANYTLLESEQNRIDTANIILGGLSLVILVIGIMNYGNMLSAVLSVRRKEIAVMQSLGLTKSQLWRMIFYEGIGYWVILILATLIAGSPVIWLLGKAIKSKLLYFKFIYPWKLLFIISVVVLQVLCESGIVFFLSVLVSSLIGGSIHTALQSMIFSSGISNTDLTVLLGIKDIGALVGFGSILVSIALCVSIFPTLKANPKDILAKMEG